MIELPAWGAALAGVAVGAACGFTVRRARLCSFGAVEDAWMGDGRAEAGPDDIVRALKLYRTACALQFTLVFAGAGIWLYAF